MGLTGLGTRSAGTPFSPRSPKPPPKRSTLGRRNVAARRLRVAFSEGLQVPGRDRRHAARRDVCVQEARRQDFSLLERREVERRRYGVAVLESDGFHAGGTAGA